jgi:hypothetical protein
MGSSKSKPIAESARSVLNKRQAQAPSPESLAQGVYFNVKNISVWYKPETLQKEIAPAQQAATTESTDLNPTLLREISKWDIVRSTTKDTQVRIHNVLISFFTMPMMFHNFIAKHLDSRQICIIGPRKSECPKLTRKHYSYKRRESIRRRSCCNSGGRNCKRNGNFADTKEDYQRENSGG